MRGRKEEPASTKTIEYTRWEDGRPGSAAGAVPSEEAIEIYVDGNPLVGLRCSPTLLEELALGFLYNEGLIEDVGDVARITVREPRVDVYLDRENELPTLRHLWRGCSGGGTFRDLAAMHQRVDSELRIRPELVQRLAGERLLESTPLHQVSGGLHGAMLADGESVLCVAEDVGRHNALDKVAGICLGHGWGTRDRIVVTTGRSSSDTLAKVARMRVPVVISCSSPTSLSVRLAREWGITLIGYARGRSFRVYAGAERVQV
jgi:FdhD protein